MRKMIELMIVLARGWKSKIQFSYLII
jgi:hypothetical protein